MKELVKSSIGNTLELLFPRIRMRHTCLLLSHMRCGTSALTHVLTSHPAIKGYGECHIPYRARPPAGRLAINLAKRRIHPFGGQYLFDKILHNDHDDAVDSSFFESKAIFMIREPLSACASMMHLKSVYGKTEVTPDERLSYYTGRLRQLQELWLKFTPANRFFVQYENLVKEPDLQMKAISKLLQLNEPLQNHYSREPISKEDGSGDPLYCHQHTSIQRIEKRPLYEGYIGEIQNCERLKEAVSAHRSFCSVATNSENTDSHVTVSTKAQ